MFGHIILVWRAGVKARLFFDYTRQSYGVLIADAFLGAVVRVPPGEPASEMWFWIDSINYVKYKCWGILGMTVKRRLL